MYSVEPSTLVKKYFQMRDYYILEGGKFEFRVKYDTNSKTNFVMLLEELSKNGMTATMKGTKEDTFIVVEGITEQHYKPSRLIYVFAFLTAGALILSGILQASLYSCLNVPINSWYASSLYVAAIVSIIGIHETSHHYFAVKKKDKPPSSFFIPGLPGVTSFLPTLGSILIHREPSTNRDTLFDSTIVGPLVGVLVSSIFFVVGQSTSMTIPFPQGTTTPECQSVPIVQINPNLIQLGLSTILPQKITQSGLVQVSPLIDASVIGFLISFISLLPCSALDGGVLSRIILGQRGASLLSIGSVLLLLAIDSPSYWLIAIALSFVLNRGFEKGFKDEVSELSSRKKFVFLAAILLGLLSIPLPQNIFYISL